MQKALRGTLIITLPALALIAGGYAVLKNSTNPPPLNAGATSRPVAQPSAVKPGGKLRICGPVELSMKNRLAALVVTEQVAPMDDPGPSYLYVVDLQSPESPNAVIKNGDYAAWSPDGNTLAFSRKTDEVLWSNVTASRIGLYSWSTGKASELADGFVDRGPAWEPGGNMLAFARTDLSHAGELNGLSGWIMLKRGDAKPHRVGPAYLSVARLRWHPSADKIAYIGNTYVRGPTGLPRSTDLYLLDIGSGKAVRLTDTSDISKWSLDWSPDGRLIAFATGISWFKTLELLEPATGKRRVVLKVKELPESDISRVSSIRWSPGGDRIAFDIWTTSDVCGPADVGCLTWPELRFTRLTNDRKSRAPRWTSDGSRILFVRDPDSIWSIRPDGKDEKEVFVVSP